MRVLVTWGSKRGGTEGIARTVGETLRAEGVRSTCSRRARQRRPPGLMPPSSEAPCTPGAGIMRLANSWAHGCRSR